MGLEFEWDPATAEANQKNHGGVSFEEASTVFADPLSVTIPDPDHSEEEGRLLLLGRSRTGTLLVISFVERGERIRVISARKATAGSGDTIRRPKDEAEKREVELREEYDFSGGVRGKYAARYAEGTNLVRLDPDVAKVFPDRASVNEALRALVKIVERKTDAA